MYDLVCAKCRDDFIKLKKITKIILDRYTFHVNWMVSILIFRRSSRTKFFGDILLTSRMTYDLFENKVDFLNYLLHSLGNKKYDNWMKLRFYSSFSPNDVLLCTIYFSEWLKLFFHETQTQLGETDHRISLTISSTAILVHAALLRSCIFSSTRNFRKNLQPIDTSVWHSFLLFHPSFLSYCLSFTFKRWCIYAGCCFKGSKARYFYGISITDQCERRCREGMAEEETYCACSDNMIILPNNNNYSALSENVKKQ